MSLSGKQTVAVDFDGVVSDYANGWQGYGVLNDKPVPGAREAIEHFRLTHNVVVCSCRASTPEGKRAIEEWLAYYGIVVDGVQSEKPVAEFLVDDRAIEFRGNWGEIVGRFEDGFLPWTKVPISLPEEAGDA